MFKSVEYHGFEGHPDLLALAERGQRALMGEIRAWRNEVEVQWVANPKPEADFGVLLELRLTLPYSTGIVRQNLKPTVFSDEIRLRRACRRVWSELLDIHLDQQDARLAEYLATPLEV